MLKQGVGVITVFWVMLFWVNSAVAQVADLYRADVAAASERNVWQQHALVQVLHRVSGNSAIVNNAAVQAELKNAAAYIKQFETQRQADGSNTMRVLLDAEKVNQLLTQQGIPVLGALRPQTLVWLVQQQQGERQFVRQSTHNLNQLMQQAFDYFALPMLMPLYDIDDLLSLTETDVWAGFWQPIFQASQRYPADVVVAATILTEEQSGQVIYRMNWQLQQEGRTYRVDLSAESEAELMQQFAASLAEHLAKRYATVMSAEGEISLLLEIQQVPTLADIVRVQRDLAQLVGVTQVTVIHYQQSNVRFELRTNVSAESVKNALRFNKMLQSIVQDASSPLPVDGVPVLATYRYLAL
uniref:DUF2066 domain-containing protein n=1 Tax=Rheinheimera sp. BAL341 TaxID=1708203 RepID=A0A486XMU8_9GAMM